MAMRFMATFPDGPREPAFSVWRRDSETALYERWDPMLNEWVEDPFGIRETGIGGDSDFEDVTERRAQSIIENVFNGPAGATKS